MDDDDKTALADSDIEDSVVKTECGRIVKDHKTFACVCKSIKEYINDFISKKDYPVELEYRNTKGDYVFVIASEMI